MILTSSQAILPQTLQSFYPSLIFLSEQYQWHSNNNFNLKEFMHLINIINYKIYELNAGISTIDKK